MKIVQLTDTSAIRLISQRIGTSCRIVCITGAGISTSCGIPDFRSPGGIYSSKVGDMLEDLSKDLQDRVTDNGTVLFRRDSQPLFENIDPADRQMTAQSLLDTSIFTSRSRTTAMFRFCVLLREYIIQRVDHASQTHTLLQSLAQADKLSRCFTQNIDSLEARVGLRFATRGSSTADDRDGRPCVQLHGDLCSVRCRLERCQAAADWTPEVTMAFYAGQVLPCAACDRHNQERQRRGLRSITVGSVRPNLVLYGEEGPDASMIGEIQERDITHPPELLLILGTSLKTDGARQLAKDLSRAVHRHQHGLVVFVNRQAPGQAEWSGLIDYCVESDCDRWSEEVVSQLPVPARNDRGSKRRVARADRTHSSLDILF